MRGLLHMLIFLILLSVFVPWSPAQAAEPNVPVRGILVGPDRVTAEFLRAWKGRGVTTVAVPLDEATRHRWDGLARVAQEAGLALWPWIEVARNPAMADAHPAWMAAPGGHHDDWLRRFPKCPKAKPGEVIKAWPWVPIGHAPALDAHRARLKSLLDELPGAWSGVFLNDLQAGPSSCGCGNDQCRWALDYGAPETAARTPGDDAAARVVAELLARHPGKQVVPVWVTECELVDLPGARDGTGLCGGVGCAEGDCWPRYVRNWNPLLRATDGPIAVALWPGIFQRNPERWLETGLALFQKPPRGGTPLAPEKSIAIVQAWDRQEAALDAILDRMKPSPCGWVLALDPIDQSWDPRAVPIAR